MTLICQVDDAIVIQQGTATSLPREGMTDRVSRRYAWFIYELKLNEVSHKESTWDIRQSHSLHKCVGGGVRVGTVPSRGNLTSNLPQSENRMR